MCANGRHCSLARPKARPTQGSTVRSNTTNNLAAAAPCRHSCTGSRRRHSRQSRSGDRERSAVRSIAPCLAGPCRAVVFDPVGTAIPCAQYACRSTAAKIYPRRFLAICAVASNHSNMALDVSRTRESESSYRDRPWPSRNSTSICDQKSVSPLFIWFLLN